LTGFAGFLSGEHDAADFALRLLHKEVGLGREVGVPMQLSDMAYEELTEALNRGRETRNSSVGQLLQIERSGVEPPPSTPSGYKRSSTPTSGGKLRPANRRSVVGRRDFLRLRGADARGGSDESWCTDALPIIG
jgi:hypothetical protein